MVVVDTQTATKLQISTPTFVFDKSTKVPRVHRALEGLLFIFNAGLAGDKRAKRFFIPTVSIDASIASKYSCIQTHDYENPHHK
jgi:hypothetical protein